MPLGLKVLLVDDDHEFAAMVGRLFRAWFGDDLELLHLRNPAELEMALAGQGSLAGLDLIVAELNFPHAGKSPVELLEWLADLSREREVPIIVITDSKERNLPVRAYQAGITDFFEKSTLQISLLESRLRLSLERERRRRELDLKMRASLEELETTQTASQQQIRDLSETIDRMRTELEQEYQNKLQLEKDKNRMQSVFGMYVDPKIVEGILSEEIAVDQKGRRQDVTVMFADLRGYTSMTEDMDPEKVISFLNEYFTSMTEVIMGYGGMVDKYIGDGIMCVFGTPIPDPEHRDKALLTAMEMFSIFELWQTNWEANYNIRPAMGIGLASGDVVVGNVGSFQKISYTAVGDTVNLAARLESLAKPGEVLISSDLFEKINDATRQKYSFEQLEPIDIRGKRGKHQVYRLVQEFDADDILQFG